MFPLPTGTRRKGRKGCQVNSTIDTPHLSGQGFQNRWDHTIVCRRVAGTFGRGYKEDDVNVAQLEGPPRRETSSSPGTHTIHTLPFDSK